MYMRVEFTKLNRDQVSQLNEPSCASFDYHFFEYKLLVIYFISWDVFEWDVFETNVTDFVGAKLSSHFSALYPPLP